MLPQHPAAGFSQGSRSRSRILIAVDDSEGSARALGYVGSLLRDARDVQVTLFHVLKPMPRELLEHGGSEDPAEERRLAEALRRDQENWVRAETAIESPILVNALDLFGKTGFPLERVALKSGCEDSVAHTILDEARSGGYDTIVVSRHDSNGLNRLMHGSVTDQLLRDAAGFTLWVVE
ncbi:MAG TPA: universal stress protein [Nitrospira sp.]|nr:universal stress protein [Nitrospira sp.]